MIFSVPHYVAGHIPAIGSDRGSRAHLRRPDAWWGDRAASIHPGLVQDVLHIAAAALQIAPQVVAENIRYFPVLAFRGAGRVRAD